MLLGEIIKQYRKQHHLSLQNFADLISSSKSYVRMLEKNFNPSTGKIINPSIKTLSSLASAMNMNIETLLQMLDTDQYIYFSESDYKQQFNEFNIKLIKIDIINPITNEVVGKTHYSYRTDIADEDPKNYFAVSATDNSMAPLLDIGDIAIIKKFKEFSNRRTYLLKIKKGNPIIRKVIQLDTGNIELQALNMWNFPIQKDLTLNDVDLLGEVVEVHNNSAFNHNI